MSEPTTPLSPYRFALVSTPLLMGLGIFAAIGLFIVLTSIGGTARGERVTVTVQSSCPADWSRLLLSRAQELGLGEPQARMDGDRARLTATLPGLEGDRVSVPALLTAQGVFEVHAAQAADQAPQGQALATSADVEEIYLQLDLSGHPFAEVHLQPLAAQRLRDAGTPVLLYRLDGVTVDTYDAAVPFPGTLELHPALEHTRDELRLATDWTVLLRTGPAPCPATAVQVDDAG